MKPWHKDIERHIAMWSAREGHPSWWPRYVYHFTDVRNAVAILQGGCLYSRAEATRLGLMQVDNASAEIIGQTQPEHLEFVRLYFRPRTPTQFRNEGVRPREQRNLGAHCPVPVYFCFDALDVLSRDETEYSDGNMASSRVRHSGGREFFLNIPFNLVFHEGAIKPHEDKAEITFRRNAEVLVPTFLPLDPALRFISCRSAAERQTLIHLLPPAMREQWASKIRVADQGLFYRRWTYVEQVVAMNEIVAEWVENGDLPDAQTQGRPR